jgi:hypothetical protein
MMEAGHVLHGVKDDGGLRAKVQTGRLNKSFRSRKSGDRKPEVTQWRATEGHCVSTVTCRRPIGVL